MAAQRLVVWFRNDLRLTDNPAIAEAAKRIASDKTLELIPVYCFDPRHFKPSSTSHGYRKTGVHRARFMIEAVTDLRSRLRAIGSDLVVHHATPEACMPSLLKTGAGAGAKTTIMAQEEVCWEELAVDKAVRASVSNKGGKLELHWGYSLYHRFPVSSPPCSHLCIDTCARLATTHLLIRRQSNACTCVMLREGNLPARECRLVYQKVAFIQLMALPPMRRDDLPDKFKEDLSGMPDVMTPFKDACERSSRIRPPMPAPSKLPPLPADIQVGSFSALRCFSLCSSPLLPSPATISTLCLHHVLSYTRHLYFHIHFYLCLWNVFK